MTSTTGSGCGGRAGWTTHADNAAAQAITPQYWVKDVFSLIRFPWNGLGKCNRSQTTLGCCLLERTQSEYSVEASCKKM
jgi:hypothetical protein